MSRIPLHRSQEPEPRAVTRIQTAIQHAGFSCSREQAVEVWRAYSDACCATWAAIDPNMPEGDLAHLLLDFIEPMRS